MVDLEEGAKLTFFKMLNFDCEALPELVKDDRKAHFNHFDAWWQCNTSCIFYFFSFFFWNLKAAKKKINLTPKSSGEDGNFWRKKQNKTKQKNITGHHAVRLRRKKEKEKRVLPTPTSMLPENQMVLPLRLNYV